MFTPQGIPANAKSPWNWNVLSHVKNTRRNSIKLRNRPFHLKHFKAWICPNRMFKFLSYLAENTLHLNYKDHPLMTFNGNTRFFFWGLYIKAVSGLRRLVAAETRVQCLVSPFGLCAGQGSTLLDYYCCYQQLGSVPMHKSVTGGEQS